MKYILIIMFGLLLWTGCGDEETLEPSTEPEFRYVLPQGDHDYDDRIVRWYEDCGFYILYKFEDKDVYYNESMPWEGFVQDTIVINESVQVYSHRGLSVEQADETYVGQQLAWIEEMFLNHYSKDLLRLAMPKKVILGKDLKYCLVLGNNMLSEQPQDYNMNIANTLIFSHGDSSINELSNDVLVDVKNALHNWLLIDNLSAHYPVDKLTDFFAVTDYSKTLSADYYEEWLAEGWLGRLSDSEEQAQEEDVKTYVEMIITTPKKWLEVDVNSLPMKEWFEAMNYDYAGYLNVATDVNGNIKKKYDVLVSVFKDWGVDLEAIGNMYYE